MMNYVRGALAPFPACGRQSGDRSPIIRRLAFQVSVTAVAIALSQAQASAQSVSQVNQPPLGRMIDANGVDLIAGALAISDTNLTIGTPASGSSFNRYWQGNGWRHTYSANISGEGTVRVNFGNVSESFTYVGGVYRNDQGGGSRLLASGSTPYRYVGQDGTAIDFYKDTALNNYYGSDGYRISSMTTPSGETITYYYIDTYTCYSFPYSCQSKNIRLSRLNLVKSSAGYGFKPRYMITDTPQDLQRSAGWYKFASISLYDTSVNSCQTTTDTCSFTQSWPVASYSEATSGVNTFETATRQGNTTQYTRNSTGAIISIKRPGSSAANVLVSYTGSRISSIVVDGVSTTYSSSDSGSIRTVVVTPGGQPPTTYTFDTTIQKIKSVTDPLNRITRWDYDGAGRASRVTFPDQNYSQFSYDARGNITENRSVAKPGAGLADIVSASAFPSTCSNYVTCNQPITTTDARGGVTAFTYDGTHGGVLTVTAPAQGNGIRPQTRYTYAALQNSASGSSAYRLTSTSSCRTSASCAGTSDEVRVVLGYQPAHLWPSSSTISSGDGSVASSNSIGYDAIGNVTSVDGPLPGAVDVTNFTYDALRRQTSVVTPDPDGSGPMMRRAKVIHYTPDDLVDTVSIGTTDASGGSFASQQQVVSSFDANNRKVTDVVSSGGATYGVTQYGYDAVGRLQCTAVRMDPNQWGGQTDACTPQTTGASGPDRVAKLVYDAASQVTSRFTGFGAGAAVQSEEKTSYTANGEVASVTDGNGNVTGQAYDGFDRPSTTTLPDESFEQLGYDANGNVTSRRLRDGTSIGYAYDALNRMTQKTLPSGEPTTSYSYDLLGHVTGITRSDGLSQTFGFDALGRLVSDTQPGGALTYQYDAAGRRTRMTWGDGLWIGYDYLANGAVSAIREYGAASGAGVLASYGYDDLGRRTTLTRGNGVVTRYGYDAVSRLASLVNDAADTTKDQSYGFAYNPAGQIVSRTASNDLYAWKGAYNVDRPYTVNGLNQLTAAGATALGYDARGNLTQSGTMYYAYTAENLMKSASAPTATTFGYDGLGRMMQVLNTNDNRFVYDGGNIATHVKVVAGVATIAKRYVWGPGDDEALVWYEGTGTADRRWMVGDERGSVVALTDGTGTVSSINTYDEYGIPGAITGQFGYTGQMWVSSLKMSNYKARMYSPTLGRFMQTDPIGYGDGLNGYNYVGGDPVNATDPSGTCGADENPYNSNGTPCEVTVVGGGGGGGIPGNYNPYGNNPWGSTGSSANCPTGSYRIYGQCVSDTGAFFSQRAKTQTASTPQRTNPACTSGRYTLGGQFSATGFLASFGISGNVEVGVALPTRPSSSWNPFAGVQVYARAQGLGLAGLGFFAGAGVSGVGGLNGSPLTTGVQTSVVAQGGFAAPAGGEASVSLDGSGASVSGGPRAGAGGYLAGGAGKTATLTTAPLGCPR